MREVFRILLVEDVPADAELIEYEVRQVLPAADFMRVDTYNDFLDGLESYYPHLILSDYRLPRFDGIMALRLTTERRPEVPFLLITGSLNEETAVECMKAGAWDYILKEQLKRLGPAVLGALEKKRLRDEHRQAAEELRKREEQYRLLLESTEAIAWEYNVPVDVWTYVAPQATNILGYEPGEWHDYDFWLEKLHPDDREWASAYCAEHAARGINHTFEYRFRKKSGDYVWLRDVVSVEMRAGAPVTLRGYMLDITSVKQAQLLLGESEKRYRSLFENNHAVMLLIDPDSGQIVDANPAAAAYYGWAREELCRRTIGEINTLAPNELQGELARSRQGSRHFHFCHRLADGSVRDVEVFSGPIVVGHRVLLFSIISDVSAWKKAQAGLHLAQFCIDNAAIGIFRVDEQGHIRDANAHACASLDYSRQELCRLKVTDINPQISIEEWREHRRIMRSKGSGTIETYHRRRDGSVFPVEVTVNYFEYEGELTSFSFVRDITERKAYEQQLEHQATHDGLTGLANRALLYDRLAQAIRYSNRSRRLLALLFLNIDRFKIINDSLDHGAGDDLLCQMAKRLQRTVRETDTVARLGGDEFVVLLAELDDAGDAALLARKIKELLGRPYLVGGREITLTASVGISLYPQDGADAQSLLRNANLAMYRAKEERDTLRFYAKGIDGRVADTLDLEADLRQALARNELLLHYQPKVDLRTGRITGAEALMRWQHPQRGMISPDTFIPLAEETGLILPIGDWVLINVCRQIVAWQQGAPRAVPIAVNLSACQFIRDGLAESIEKILVSSGVDPALLELELTESMLMRDPQRAAGTMQKIRMLGVRLALDDFGTGYSSLNYLRRFPVDCLKIDRSFIADVATDPSAAAVAASVVAIAHTLGLQAVAEGVETLEQLKFLQKCGCDSYQGFYFSRPVAAEEFAALHQYGGKVPA